MSSVLALGWALAATAAILLLLERRQARRHAEGVVRACHELRQPLTAMLMALGRPGGPGDELPAVLAPELDRARRAAEDLAGRAERRLGEVAHEPLDLVAAVTAQARLHDAVAVGQGRRVRVSAHAEDPVLPADGARLAQAVGNLLANSLQHGHGDVRVDVGEEPGGLRVSVRDDGPGRPAAPEQLARRRGRHGRGLAIARAAAAAHGGGLSVDGPAVVLELPRRPRTAGPAPDPGRRTGEAAREPVAAALR